MKHDRLPGTHDSIWWGRFRRPPLFDLGFRSHRVDVAVVGAGITGVTTAWLLRQAGLSVALLTDRTIGAGVTGHTTAHLTVVPDIGFRELVHRFGVDEASEIVRASRYALDEIFSWSRRFSDLVQPERVGGYKFAEKATQIEALEEDFEAARDLKLDVEWRSESSLPFTIAGAYHLGEQGQFHPLEYIYQLAGEISSDTSFIVEGAHVADIHEGSPCRLKMQDGWELEADSVVLATHSPIGRYLSLHTRLAPYFSYVLAVRMKHAIPAALHWDMDTPYHYLRSFSRQEEDLWIIGGYDNKTGQEADPAAHYERLRQYVLERFPVERIEYSWGDEVFEPVDGIPYIGPILGSSKIYAASGYSGTGMTWGTLAASLIAQEILGKASEWSKIFSASRLGALNSMGRLVSENANVAYEYVRDWFSSAEEEKALSEIRPGEGRVLEMRGKKTAVYRDEQGHFHFHSAICSHMGGLVRWNAAENTWDCPLHGGRYSSCGQVLNGPPLRGLAALAEGAEAKSREAEAKLRGLDLATE